MKKANQSSSNSMREQAENKLKSKSPKAGMSPSEADTYRLVHELEVHQIELEMQNEELREAREQVKLIHEKSIRELTEFTENIIDAVRNPLLVLDQDLRIVKANQPFYDFFKAGADETIGQLIYDLGNHQWDNHELLELLEKIISEKIKFDNFEITHHFETIGKQTLLLNARQIERAIDNEKIILLAFEDITEQKRRQEELHLSISRSTRILDDMLEGCMIIGFDWTYLYINESAARNGQSKRENLIGRSMLEMYPGVENSTVFAHYKRCMDERIPQRFEESFTFVDGTTVWNNYSVEPVKEGIFILALDITSRKNIEEELWRNEARLKVSLGLINFTVFNQDLDLRYTWLFQSQIGLTFEQVNGKTDEELLPPETAQKVTEIKRSVLESGRSKRGKVELNRNGKILYYDLFVEPLFSIDGQIIGITGASLDITEQKKAEDTLRISEAKWRELFEILPIGVSIVDSNRKILDFNSALCQILDLSPDDLLNNKHLGIKYWKSDHTLINPKELPSYRAIQENKTLKDLEICVEKENGSRIWINVNAAPFPTLKSSIVATIDITERKKWEEEIKSSKMQMDQLYKHINAVREEERSAIAREIHDELGQSLASLKIDLIVMKEEFDENSELKHKIDQVLTQVDSSIKTVQKISSSLRPQMLDELGLSSAIEWLSNDFRKRTGIKCKLDLQEIEDLDENLSISLFRIFQASLANIMLHSKAGSISVKLSLNNGLLLLSVKDDGIGITEEQINSPHSFGIIGMSERAKQIDGKFEIHSEINKGTEITVLVPVICKK